MKINIIHIIKAHWLTMRSADSNCVSYSDIFIFYLIPLMLGAASYYMNVTFRTDVYNVSITFFGVFIALLLNIQVAIFGIYQRKWEAPEDKRQADMQAAQLEDRRKLLSELNTNISYLTIACSFSLIAFLCLFIFELSPKPSSAITIILYSHFMLTFLMIAKRSHSLFQKEYDGSAP